MRVVAPTIRLAPALLSRRARGKKSIASASRRSIPARTAGSQFAHDRPCCVRYECYAKYSLRGNDDPCPDNSTGTSVSFWHVPPFPKTPLLFTPCLRILCAAALVAHALLAIHAPQPLYCLRRPWGRTRISASA